MLPTCVNPEEPTEVVYFHEMRITKTHVYLVSALVSIGLFIWGPIRWLMDMHGDIQHIKENVQTLQSQNYGFVSDLIKNISKLPAKASASDIKRRLEISSVLVGAAASQHMKSDPDQLALLSENIDRLPPALRQGNENEIWTVKAQLASYQSNNVLKDSTPFVKPQLRKCTTVGPTTQFSDQWPEPKLGPHAVIHQDWIWYANCSVTIDIDEIDYGNFINCEIRYHGGFLKLKSAAFFNCKFVFDLDQEPIDALGRSLIDAVVGHVGPLPFEFPKPG